MYSHDFFSLFLGVQSAPTSYETPCIYIILIIVLVSAVLLHGKPRKKKKKSESSTVRDSKVRGHAYVRDT